MRPDLLGPSPSVSVQVGFKPGVCVVRLKNSLGILLTKRLRTLQAACFSERRLEDMGSLWGGCGFQYVFCSVNICLLFFLFLRGSIFMPHPLLFQLYRLDYHNWSVFHSLTLA
jgi:hypothetical protein